MPHVLTAGDLAVEVAPERGGGIIRFDAGSVPVFGRGALRAPPAAPAEVVCHPLVPFSNRIAHARLPVGGAVVPLVRLPGQGEHPMHGISWQRPWKVAAQAPGGLVLVHAHSADAHWPFSYRVTQTLAFDAGALVVTLALTSEDARAMPAGIGLHPFFPSTPRATLTTGLADVWQTDAELLPTHREPLPAALDFAAGVVLADTLLDNCFGGWSGRATIRWPERALSLEIEASDTLGALVIYTPAGRGFFCVEPASHVNNAFQLAAAGIESTGARLLAPGETLTGTVRFRPRVEPAP